MAEYVSQKYTHNSSQQPASQSASLHCSTPPCAAYPPQSNSPPSFSPIPKEPSPSPHLSSSTIHRQLKLHSRPPLIPRCLLLTRVSCCNVRSRHLDPPGVRCLDLALSPSPASLPASRRTRIPISFPRWLFGQKKDPLNVSAILSRYFAP